MKIKIRHDKTDLKRMGRRYDFKQIEKSVAERWRYYDEKIEKAIHLEEGKPLFSWLEGPPTANAPPGIHHVEARVFKDLILRFKYMQGFTVPRKGGWDCHGLPVEVQVEKKLKLKDKKAVIKYGIPRFIAECKKDVFTFVGDWNWLTNKIGFWLDLENAYMTLSTPYMESVWWALKEIFRKGLLYEGHKVVPYCSRCETPLSSHEVAQGYEEITERTVTVKFKLKDEDVYLLAWTTTPWTLPSNTTLAVNPNLEYTCVEEKGTRYVVAKDRVERHFGLIPGKKEKSQTAKIVKTVKGKELVGKRYEPLLPYFAQLKNAFFIVPADYVTTEEGTGIVHQASAYGEIDYEVNKKHGVDFVHPVNKDGTFSEEVIDFKGMFVKDADPLILEKLEKEGKVFVTYEAKHAYPFCWRCKSPLLFYAMDSWFIKVSYIINKLLKNNDKINWYPAHIKTGRFGKWLEGAKDWALSRNKFWGTPLPVWVCESCGHQEAVGSIQELKEKSGKKVDDLHIRTVDKLKWKCPRCKAVMRRTPEVIDCWFDSGSAPFAQFHYPFENKKLFEKSFPYDFIVESVDQTRGWFYTMHVISTILFDKPAYKSCAVSSLILDEKGEKMSKSKGNIIYPKEIFEEVGVDAVRLAMCSYPLGGDIRFGRQIFKETINPFFNTLWNAFFFSRDLFAKVEDPKLQVEDRWMISRINSLAKKISAYLDNHDYNKAVEEITYFVSEDLSRWYIKLVRERADTGVSFTLTYVLERLLRIMAPFTPYVSDELYYMLTKKDVHFEPWPKPEKIEEALEESMDIVREAITAILAARDKAGLGVRWPLKEVILDSTDKALDSAVDMLGDIIKKHTNVKHIEVKRMDVTLKLKPNYRNLGKDFGEETAKVIEAIQNNHENLVKDIRDDEQEFKVGKYNLRLEHLEITKKAKVGWEFSDFSTGSAFINVDLDEQLVGEGYTREVIRRVQQMRKEAKLEKKDKIDLVIVTHYPKMKNFEKEIEEKVGAKSIVVCESCKLRFKHEKKEKIKEFDFGIMFNKV